ncbi:MAG: ATP-dependent DNA helicase [bacterium]|nr:ATP-dependent DNA helicase [bacterium]
MDNLLENLNAAQTQAVTHDQGPLLIVAGAGTGKTTVLTRRYAYLLKERGCKTDRLLALTFTEKAAGEMEERVIQLLPSGTYDFWISTFHGFCQRVLEAHGLEIGLPNQFRLLTPTDAWLLLKRRFEELPLDHYRPLGNPIKFLRGILQHISRAKDEGISPEQYQAFVTNAVLDGDTDVVLGEKKRLQELVDIYFAYRRILLDEGSLDFGDLILETLRLFRERPAVLNEYREQFKYVMVDEFQDTNWAQYELIKLLTSKKKNLTVVGDDDQAIYKFRGASLANILQFRDDFPEAVTVALTDNYRSKKEILDTAYGFIKKNNPNRLEVKLKDTGLTKQLTAVLGEGGRVNVVWERNVEDEADKIVATMRGLKAKDETLTWNDFAILTRSNDGALPFIRGLDQSGIPFQFLALRGLYSKPVVLDVIALLSLMDGYHESSYVWRALSLLCYPYPAKDLSETLQYANRKGVSLWQAVVEAGRHNPEVHVSDDGARIAAKLIGHIDALRETAKRESPLKLLLVTLDKTGYYQSIMRMPEREKVEAIGLLNGFADRIKRYETATHGPSLRGFLEELEMEIESGEEGALDFDPDAGPELVKIMTVHAAKGLEFKHVFVVSLVDQRFPTRARTDAIPLPDGLVQERLPEGDMHLEEERRLFYVALTRAKETLTLSGATHYGGTRAKKPSPFFEESGLTVEPRTAGSIDADAKRLQAPEDILIDREQVTMLYPLKRRFSFTQLAAFRKCALQYKFAHIYRIPILGSYQKSFGQSIHLAFQQMLELHLMRGRVQQGNLFDIPPHGGGKEGGAGLKGFRVTEDEALEIYESAWIDQWYEDRKRHDEYKDKGRKAVRNFWRACSESAPEILEVEKEFILIMGQHSLKGKIDRVDKLPDGSVVVLDYKTGTAKEKLETEEKEQLYLYQIALEEKGLKVGRLAYIYVMDWVFMDVEPLTGSDRDAFLTKIEERMDAILKSDYQPSPEPFTCKYCDFKNICDYKKL